MPGAPPASTSRTSSVEKATPYSVCREASGSLSSVRASSTGGSGHGHHTGQDGNPDSCFPSLRHKTVVVVGAPEQLCDREGCTSRLLDKQGFDILLHGAGFCVARRESRDRQSIKLSPVRCANQV